MVPIFKIHTFAFLLRFMIVDAGKIHSNWTRTFVMCGFINILSISVSRAFVVTGML